MKTISTRHYRDKLKQQIVTLPTGLKSQKEVYKAASKKAKRDFRGISYDAKTGRTVLT